MNPLIERVIKLIEEQNYTSAYSVLDNALSKDPNNAELYAYQARILQKKGEYERSEKILDIAFKLNNKLAINYFLKGNLSLHYNNNLKAIEFYKNAISIDPKYHLAYHNMGNSYSKLSKNIEAADCFKKVIEIDPEFHYAYASLGNVLSCLGQKSEAVKIYSKAIELNPKDIGSYNNMGTALYDLNKSEEAIEIYKKGLEIDPKFTFLHYNIALSLLRLEKYSEATQSYKQCLELDPKRDKSYHNMVISLNNLEKYEEAIDSFRKLVELDTKNALLYNSEGNSYRNLEKVDEAIDSYNKAIEINPNFVTAYNNLALSYIVKGDYLKSLEYIEKSLKIDSELSETWYIKGSINYILLDKNNAMINFTKSIDLFHEYPLAYCKRGMLLKENGHIEEAKRDLKNAYELYKEQNWGGGKYNIFKSDKEYIKKIIENNLDFIGLSNSKILTEDTNNHSIKDEDNHKIDNDNKIGDKDTTTNKDKLVQQFTNKISEHSYSLDTSTNISDMQKQFEPVLDKFEVLELSVTGESSNS